MRFYVSIQLAQMSTPALLFRSGRTEGSDSDEKIRAILNFRDTHAILQATCCLRLGVGQNNSADIYLDHLTHRLLMGKYLTNLLRHGVGKRNDDSSHPNTERAKFFLQLCDE